MIICFINTRKKSTQLIEFQKKERVSFQNGGKQQKRPQKLTGKRKKYPTG